MTTAKERFLKRVSEWYDERQYGDGDGEWLRRADGSYSSLYRRLTIEIHSVQRDETEQLEKRIVFRTEDVTHFLDVEV